MLSSVGLIDGDLVASTVVYHVPTALSLVIAWL